MTEIQTLTQPPENNPFGTVQEMTNLIKESRRPVNYGEMIMSDTRVFALGETHTMKDSKNEANIALNALHDHGFTHLGLEMVDASVQGILNEYLTSGVGREKIYAHIDENFRWNTNSASQYMEIIDEAKRLGMKVIALDLSSGQRELTEHDQLLDERDKEMEKHVTEVLEESSSNKVVTFTGNAHASYGEKTMAQLLRNKGVGVVSAFIIGELNPTTYLEKAAVQANAATERFMLPARAKFPETISSPSTDWLIHLPQIQKGQNYLIPNNLIDLAGLKKFVIPKKFNIPDLKDL